jgi:iron complex transport system substrate-binding protein
MRVKRLVTTMVLALFLLILTVACGETGSEPSEASEEKERVISHMMGETVIQGEPKRVVALQDYLIDHLLSLGITPVAASNMADGEFPDYLKAELKDTVNLGNVMEPNLELILDQEPDLIIAQEYHQEHYDSLSQIAPTVLINRDELDWDWKAVYLEVARIVDKEDRAKQVLKEYEQKAAAAGEEIKGAVGDETFLFLRVMEKEVRVYGVPAYTVLYEDMGLKPGPNVPEDEWNQPISLEALPDFDADHIFLLDDSQGLGSGSEAGIPELLDISVWKNMKAVQQDQVYTVDYDLWFQTWGPIGYEAMIEDAVRIVK